MSSPPTPSPPPEQPVNDREMGKPPSNTTIPSAGPEAQREEAPSDTIAPPPPPGPGPGPPTTSPSPSPTPHSPSRKPSLALPSRLQSIIRLLVAHTHRLAHRTDKLLLRLSALLSNPTSTDALLSTTSYTLTLLSSLLRKTLTHRLSTLATTLATNTSAILLPGETLVAAIPAPRSTKALIRLSESAKALAATIDDYRIFVRLWGLVGIYTWARATYLSPSPSLSSSPSSSSANKLPNPDAGRRDKLLKAITWSQIASCTIFQLLENLAYLSSKSVLTLSSKTGESLEVRNWIWSSRFWAVHVGLEFLRLYVISHPSSTTDDGEKESKMKREKVSWTWTRDLVTNLAYFPLTIHWGRKGGLLSETGVAVLGVVAGGMLVVDAWRGFESGDGERVGGILI